MSSERSGRSQRSLASEAPVVAAPVSLVGPGAERIVRGLVDYALGLQPLPEMGGACDYAPDGTIRLHVDQVTFEALELNE